MTDLLVDTDVFVDILRAARMLDRGRDVLSYSIITRCELFAGRRTNEEAVRSMLAAFRELPVTPGVAEAAGRIRRETGIPVPDAIIGATAIEHRLTLLTRNKKDFDKVRGLKVRSPA